MSFVVFTKIWIQQRNCKRMKVSNKEFEYRTGETHELEREDINIKEVFKRLGLMLDFL